MTFKTWIVSALSGLALVACGGGGGGDSSPAGVQVPSTVRVGTASASSNVSAGNALSFAGPLARIAMSGADGGVPGVSNGRETPQARSAAAVMSRPGMTFVFDAAARSLNASAAREQAQAVTTETGACTFGGTIQVPLHDADNNRKLSAGDSATITLTACVETAGYPPATGVIAFGVNAVELDAQSLPTALDANLTLNGLTELGFGSINGSVRIRYKDEAGGNTRQRLGFLATNVFEAGQTVVYDFDAYGVDGASGGSYDLNGAVTIAGLAYALSSTQFSYAAGGWPSSGALTVRDAAGDAVIVRARSATTFDVEFQAAGATTSTVVQSGLLWANYQLGS